MPDPQQDWFASNAPAAPAARSGGDWFASNQPKAAATSSSVDEQGEETSPQDRAKNAAYDALPRLTKAKLILVPGAMDEWSKQFYDGKLDPSGPTSALGKVMEPTLMKMAEGTGDVLEGDISKGGHKIISSASLMALPLMTKGALAAPVTALKAAAGGYVGGKLAEGGTAALGGNEDQKAFAEDLGNLGGAGVGANFELTPNMIAKLKAAGIVGAQFGASKIPLAGGLVRRPSVFDLFDALKTKADPQMELYKNTPKLGDSPIFSTADVKPTMEGTAAGPVPSGEAAPAPYRLSGNQIQDATTVTPRRILGPDRQLAAAPPEATAAAPAAPPKTGQVLKDAGVTQAMKEAGIAAPSASARAVRPGVTAQLAPRADIQFPPGLSGEDASLMQLTRYNINELRFMANKRGLPVSPKDTHAALIDKIQGSLTPDETAGFTAAAQATKVTPSKFPENNLMAQNLNDAASALQQAKGSPYEIASLRNAASRIQQHPESIAAVDLTKTKIPGVDKRIGKRIADFLEQQKAVPGQDEVQTTTGQPMSMLDAMRQSLIQRGVKPPY